jgi:hypothetical protein
MCDGWGRRQRQERGARPRTGVAAPPVKQTEVRLPPPCPQSAMDVAVNVAAKRPVTLAAADATSPF